MPDNAHARSGADHMPRMCVLQQCLQLARHQVQLTTGQHYLTAWSGTCGAWIGATLRCRRQQSQQCYKFAVHVLFVDSGWVSRAAQKRPSTHMLYAWSCRQDVLAWLSGIKLAAARTRSCRETSPETRQDGFAAAECTRR